MAIMHGERRTDSWTKAVGNILSLVNSDYIVSQKLPTGW